MRSWSPGRAGLRKRTPSMDMNMMTLSATATSRVLDISRAPVWAMASTISTPGMTGSIGKCPWKKGSLWLTFLMPTMEVRGTKASALSTSRKG